MRSVAGERRIVRFADGVRAVSYDSVAAEEPMEIRVGGEAVAVTMRTPGHDFELAAGFILTEGLVDRPGHIERISYCAAQGEAQRYNVVGVDVSVRRPVPPRNFVTNSSCGVCGIASIEGVQARAVGDVADDAMVVPAGVLAQLPDRLRNAQRVFARTGGLHAAGLFDAAGELVCLREDVGRHNAFDKVIGWAAMAGRLPLRSHVILASGRASFELTQKALVAGIPLLAAVSAPSSLAVDLAAASGMTLVGFLRGTTMNVYCGDHRVV